MASGESHTGIRKALYFPVAAQGELDTVPVPAKGAEVRASVAHPDAASAIVYFGGNAEETAGVLYSNDPYRVSGNGFFTAAKK